MSDKKEKKKEAKVTAYVGGKKFDGVPEDFEEKYVNAGKKKDKAVEKNTGNKVK